VGNSGKWSSPQVEKVTKFKRWVGNVQMGLTTGGQSVINLLFFSLVAL
jgi:hypothetical protein